MKNLLTPIYICSIPFTDEHGTLYSAEFAYDCCFAGHFSISYSDKCSTISIEHFFSGVIWAGQMRYSHYQGNPQLAIELPVIITTFKQANPELFI